MVIELLAIVIRFRFAHCVFSSQRRVHRRPSDSRVATPCAAQKVAAAVAAALATQSEPLAELPIKWSGTKSTRRPYAAMCNIPADISKDELERRRAVFGASAP
jgi:hypothetical protein